MNRYEKARALGCPRCGAEPDSPCTYLPVKDVDETSTWWRRGRALEQHRALQARVGTPTKVPHFERLDALIKAEAKITRKHAATRRRKQLPPVVGPSPEIIAVKEFDRQEFETMRDWLRDNFKILIGGS